MPIVICPVFHPGRIDFIYVPFHRTKTFIKMLIKTNGTRVPYYIMMENMIFLITLTVGNIISVLLVITKWVSRRCSLNSVSRIMSISLHILNKLRLENILVVRRYLIKRQITLNTKNA